MAIENTIKRMLSAAGLVGVLAGSACGEDKDKESCTKDTDCNPGRECDSDLGYCVDANGGSSGSSSGSSSNPCGNSPLFGKYLWFIGNCEMGFEKPFDKDCKGYLTDEDGTKKVCDYNGLTITWEKYSLTLTKDLSCSNLDSDSYKNCSDMQCAIQQDDIYTRTGLNEFKSNDALYSIRSVPWPKEEACWTQIKTEEWYISCF